MDFGMTFEAQTENFEAFLDMLNIKRSPKLTLADLRGKGRGRGVVATGDFEEDELIFSIPRKSTLNAKSAIHSLRPSTIELLSPELLAGMPPWTALAAIILSEAQHDQSLWKTYLEILPWKLDSLVFWSPSELAELQASAVVDKIGKSGAEEIYHKHIASLFPSSTIEEFHQVASTIMAYAFDVPEDEVEDENDDGEELIPDDDEKTILSMIPLADMLNADGDNNACLSYGMTDLEMRTIKPIKAGEEILNDYGQLPRSDLLRRYGYITNKYEAYDVVEISSSSIINAFRNGLINERGPTLTNAEIDARLDLAKREDLHEDSYDIGHATEEFRCIPDELLALLWLFLIDAETFSSVSQSDSSLASRSKMETVVVGNVLGQLLRLREREYTTTAEQDAIILQEGGLSHRYSMAVNVRLGEKKILREAIQETISYQSSNRKMRCETGKRERGEETAHSQKRNKTR